MNNKNTVNVKKGLSAGILTILRGKLSNFNQSQIVCFSALLILIIICIANLDSHSEIFIPLFRISILAFFILLINGIIRNWVVKPEDETYSSSAKFTGVNRVIEMKNVPRSLLSRELLITVASLTFYENEPPVGLIKGDVGDDQSIKLLTKEERKELKEKENKDIQEHQRKIAQELRKAQQISSSKENSKD